MSKCFKNENNLEIYPTGVLTKQESLNIQIEMLYKTLEAKDKIINKQVLEIAKLNNEIEFLQNDLDNTNSKLSEVMKSHLEAIQYIKATIKIIKDQPSSCELNDIWILEHLNSLLETLVKGEV